MGFKVDKYTRNPFLKGEDLEEGERIVVTIKSAEEVTFPSGDTVPVIEFMELDQKLTLNKTRIKRLVEILGGDTEEWIGQRISMYAVPVQFNGKSMMSVAVGKAPAKKAAKPAKPTTVDTDDDVEFMEDEEAPF